MAEKKILIKNMKFEDPDSIAPGDLVYWRNEDRMEHTATSDDGGKDLRYRSSWKGRGIGKIQGRPHDSLSLRGAHRHEGDREGQV